ncbi:MAG: 30S ribosomal protein S2 [Candidatus Paracaedibacteraceae bacterium]|nr:30S ribosomal protein S2 [Candidatus Paracaedibacteraceae bacterium]
MANTQFTMRQLLEAGVHFGHHPRRWNPKMSQYIFGKKGSVHIIDLQQTYPMLKKALDVLTEVAAQGGRILFVGTKIQATEIVAEAAKRCGQYYVNHRWLGGMLTNWKTISQSIKRLKELDEALDNQNNSLTKKELLKLEKDREKLNRALGGIREMGDTPDALFIIDTNKESTALLEAKKLGIPIVAVCDTNSDPDLVDYIIPGNDDARRAIEFYTKLVSDAVLAGIQKQLTKAGVDVGASEEIAPLELATEEVVAAADSTN